ncbi:hypothetical protein BC938DRAFT_479132 [Jimgerdemannia flammicorona]|uniref:EF-hand domain-containing protein n=1 Tax=Jimgerdemannia flammicorona TaxID=994334 RepID=A0A433QLI1_9FUNG|nr:hypothetical protein BC938DRAFT_479132 [Jimgerdemannia flammicorona]
MKMTARTRTNLAFVLLLLLAIAGPTAARIWFGNNANDGQAKQQTFQNQEAKDASQFQKSHMLNHHNVEVSDEITFFKMHDLNQDGYLDESELRSLYGFERNVNPNAPHIRAIIGRALSDMDTDRDGRISLREYLNKQMPEMTAKEKVDDAEWIKNNPSHSTPVAHEQKKSETPKPATPGGGYTDGVPNKYRVDA